MKDIAVYSALRIALFVGLAFIVAAVMRLFTAPVPIVPVLVVTAILSIPASWVLLRGPRERVATRLQARAEAASRRFEDMRAREDVDDPAEGTTGEDPTPHR